jgi:hypothetical protein
MFEGSIWNSSEKFILEGVLCINIYKDFYIVQIEYSAEVILVKTDDIIRYIFELKFDFELEPPEIEVVYFEHYEYKLEVVSVFDEELGVMKELDPISNSREILEILFKQKDNFFIFNPSFLHSLNEELASICYIWSNKSFLLKEDSDIFEGIEQRKYPQKLFDEYKTEFQNKMKFLKR